MTTHYEKIQALGNRMASNLETMGVSASFNDGGLTLADKILQIHHFTEGLLLYGDKDIIQTGGTANFYALLLKDGKAVSGEIVIFDGLYGEQVITTVEDTSIIMNGDYKIILPNSQSNHQEWISIQGTDKNIIFGYYPANTSYYMEVDGGFPIWITGNSVQVIGSSIYYVDENGEDAVLDVSDCNYNTVLTPFQAGGVILETIFSSITGSNGVATVTYTGVGAGKLNVQARTLDGSFQSEPYPVTDCVYYDPVTSDTTSNYYINSDGGTSKAYDSTNQRIVVSMGSNSGRWYIDCRTSNSALDLSALLGKTVRFKVYIGGLNGSKNMKLVVQGANSPNETSNFIDDGYHYIDVTIPSDATLIRFTISPKTSDWSQNDTYYFKDFEIYPI